MLKTLAPHHKLKAKDAYDVNLDISNIWLYCFVNFITVFFLFPITVDLSGPGCDNLDGYYLQDINDMATVYALPQYNAVATRDHCDVAIRADSNRRIQYLIDLIKFNECGVEIYIYDNPTIDANPLVSKFTKDVYLTVENVW